MLTFLVLLVQDAGHGAEEGGNALFRLEPGLIIWTWVVFLALFLLLRRYAWPAIVRLTEERERKIAQQLDEAERMNAEAKAALEEHRQLLAGAKGEAQALITEAKQVAQKEREQLLQHTRDEQQEILQRAKREIDAERDRAMTQLRREAVDIALAAATKLIEKRLDSEADRKLIEEYLASVGGDRR